MQDEHAHCSLSHLPNAVHTVLPQFGKISSQAASGSDLMPSAAGAAPAGTAGTAPASRQGPAPAEWRLHQHSSFGASRSCHREVAFLVDQRPQQLDCKAGQVYVMKRSRAAQQGLASGLTCTEAEHGGLAEHDLPLDREMGRAPEVGHKILKKPSPQGYQPAVHAQAHCFAVHTCPRRDLQRARRKS